MGSKIKSGSATDAPNTNWNQKEIAGRPPGFLKTNGSS
jgi:hypothetical protein